MIKRTPFLLVAALAAVLAACGGSAPTPATGGTGTGAQSGTGSGTPTTGEPVDESTISAAIEKLATLDSFTYETAIGTKSIGDDHLVTITGVERPLDGSRSYYATTLDGVTWTSMTVAGRYFTDLGRGLEPFEPREDAAAATDPNWVGNLLGALDSRFDDFEFVGDESIDGRAVRHVALSEYELGRMLETVHDPGLETFTFELWIDAADGYLVQAHYGRLPWTTNGFSVLTEFRFELSDVGCDCPITEPTIAATPDPGTPAPVPTPVVAPEALQCLGEVSSLAIDWNPDGAPSEPVDIVTTWPGVLSSDVLAFDGMRIVLLREDTAVAEWTFDMFGRPTELAACSEAGIGSAG